MTNPVRIDNTGVRIIAVSLFCMGMGAAVGFVPGFVATALRDDLSISRAQVGLLVSVYFGCTGLGSMLGGKLTDVFGARLVIAADMAVVACVAAFSALIGEYWALVVASVIGGAAYSLVNAGTNVAIGQAVPAKRRTLAMSVKTAGVPGMAAVAAGLGAPVSDRYGWEPIFWVIVMAALVAGFVALVVFDDDRPGTTERPARVALPDGFLWFAIGAFLLIAGSQPLYSWTVAYLEESLDASAATAGAVTAIASAAGVVFMITASLRTDRVGPEQRVKRLITLLAINLVGTLMVLAGADIGVGFVAVGAIIGISAQLASIGTMHAAVVDRAPQAVARATGVTMTGYYIGALASPAAFGWLADATDTFVWSWAATAALLALALPVWAVAGRVPLAGDEPIRDSLQQGARP